MSKAIVATKLAARGSSESKRLAAKGRAAIAVVVKMKGQVERAFYTMGKALAVLDDPRIYHALGHTSFDALCTVELKVSPAQADRLIHIVNSYSAAEAKKLSSTKATAIIDLAHAIGGRTTARGLLTRGTVHVGKTTIDVRSANATKIANAAKTLREGKHTSGPGVHVSTEDARTVRAIATKIRHAKLDATITAVAADAAGGAKMRILARVRDKTQLARILG